MYVEPLPPCTTVRSLDAWSNKRAYVVQSIPGLRDTLQWSEGIDGKIYLSKRSFVHTQGNHSETYILEKTVDTSTGEVTYLQDEYGKARVAAQNLTGREDVGWTPGKIARTINEWLGVNTSTKRTLKESFNNRILPYYNYYHCSPTHMSCGILWDMRSAYWAIARRVPSPLVYFTTNPTRPLLFGSVSERTESQWRTMLDVIEPYKSVRLAMVGQYTKGYSDGPFRDVGYWCIHRGNVIQEPVRQGPLHNLGLLIVRCTYELCQQQREEANGCYAYVDCVITESNRRMGYWESLHIPHRGKAEGETHILSLDKRKVGDNTTQRYRAYQQANRRYEEKMGVPPPARVMEEPYRSYRIPPQTFMHTQFIGK